MDATIPSVKRIRYYPESAKGPFEVFIRQKDKPINVLLVSAELYKNFKSVKDVRKVNFSKLRIIFASRDEANNVAHNELLSRLYRVYVPSEQVEIDGVVHQADLDVKDIVNAGFGRFNDPRVPIVSVLECNQLKELHIENGERIYRSSHAYRVSFAGTILPDYLEINKVLIPIRLYSPKPMICTKCSRTGHTDKMCANKPRCPKCGQSHLETDCTVTENRCLLCNEGVHVNRRDCSIYKQRVKSAKARIMQKSKISYAKVIELSSSCMFDDKNPYSSLSELSDNEEEIAHCSRTEAPKRRKGLPNKGFKKAKIVPYTTNATQSPSIVENRNNSQKNIPPGFSYRNSDFPSLVSENSDQPKKNHSNKFTITQLIQTLSEALKLDPIWSDLLLKLCPLLNNIFAKLFESWPILGMFLSIDG